MEIYFAGSIRGGRDDVLLYRDMINHLGNYGEVLTEHVGNENLAVSGEDGLSDKQIHDRDMRWMSQSSVIVAEVTTPSLGVGYEIGRGIDMGKHILCLYRKQEGKSLSAMISGSPYLDVKEYGDLEQAKRVIDDYFIVLTY